MLNLIDRSHFRYFCILISCCRWLIWQGCLTRKECEKWDARHQGDPHKKKRICNYTRKVLGKICWMLMFFAPYDTKQHALDKTCWRLVNRERCRLKFYSIQRIFSVFSCFIEFVAETNPYSPNPICCHLRNWCYFKRLSRHIISVFWWNSFYVATTGLAKILNKRSKFLNLKREIKGLGFVSLKTTSKWIHYKKV